MGTVTLANGQQVESTNEEWRYECEVRAVIAMPLRERQKFFVSTERLRGKQAAEQLRYAVLDAWIWRQAAALSRMGQRDREYRLGVLERENGPAVADRIRGLL